MGDYQLRGLDVEQVFALNPIPDDCVDAAILANAQFDISFPGWELYSKAIRGDDCFDRKLVAWAYVSARIYTRARKSNGRAVVTKDSRRNEWIRQAALDALHCAVFNKFPEASVYEFSEDNGLAHKTYRRVRDSLAALMRYGLSLYAQELHYQYSRVRRYNGRVR
jgi:hypothetical protein